MSCFLSQTFSSLLLLLENLFISTHIDLWRVGIYYSFRIFFICSWFSSAVFVFCICHPLFFLDLLLFFVFYLFRRIYVWSAAIQTYLMTYIKWYVDVIKHRIATLHQLFQTHLVRIQKPIKKLSNNFICIKTINNFSVITLRMHQMFFITVSWWKEINFYWQMILPFFICSKIVYHIIQIWSNVFNVLFNLWFFINFIFLLDIFIIKGILSSIFFGS